MKKMALSPSQCSLNYFSSQFSYDFALSSLTDITADISSLFLDFFFNPAIIAHNRRSFFLPLKTQVKTCSGINTLSLSLFYSFFLPHQLCLPGFLFQLSHRRLKPPIFLSSSSSSNRSQKKRRRKNSSQYQDPRTVPEHLCVFFSLILLQVEYNSCEAVRSQDLGKTEKQFIKLELIYWEYSLSYITISEIVEVRNWGREKSDRSDLLGIQGFHISQFQNFLAPLLII